MMNSVDIESENIDSRIHEEKMEKKKKKRIP